MAQSSFKERKTWKQRTKSVVGTCCRYGIGYPLVGTFYVLNKFVFGQPRGWCGTGRMMEARLAHKRRIRAFNVPRPLYRTMEHREGEGTSLVVDEKSIRGRRRLSVSAADAKRTIASTTKIAMTKVVQAQKTKEVIRAPCRLLQLPAEVRNLIWAHVVGRRVIHIFSGVPISKQPFVFPFTATIFPIRVKRVDKFVKTVTRIGCVECIHHPDYTRPDDFFRDVACCSTCGVFVDAFGQCSGKVKNTTPTDAIVPEWGIYAFTSAGLEELESGWQPLALLETCRQIYSEAIPVLYSTNRFDFADFDLLLRFSTTILPSRLAQIAGIRVRLRQDQIESCEIKFEAVTAIFPNLRNLHVDAQNTVHNETDDVVIPALKTIAKNIYSRFSGAGCSVVLKIGPHDSLQIAGKTIEGLEIVHAMSELNQEA